MRNKEDRGGDVERMMKQASDGDFYNAFEIAAKLLGEDPYEYVEHTLRAGRKNQEHDFAQDFRVDRDDGKVVMRKVLIQEEGDQAECGFGRSGPDGVGYDYAGKPEEPPPSTPTGLWYWRVWEALTGWHRRHAQIYARYWGNGAGSIHFMTGVSTPNTDDTSMATIDGHMVERLAIRENEPLVYNGPVDPDGVVVIVNGVRRVLKW